jgi:Protein of unknown function (DUF1997)
MQSNYSDYPAIEVTNRLVDAMPPFAAPENLIAETDVMQPVRFHGQFEDCMEMHADVATVAQYLNAHPEWFRRCAHPMKAQALGNNGYALTIGRFGSFGYEVEPKIGLELLPPEEGVYRILTIPVPDYVPPGYEVDFNAAMQLSEATIDESVSCPGDITRVEWQLDLVVAIQFPRFIYRLPMSLIQSTGTSLLRQIVRQVSHRLTHKVQQDFHSSLGLPMPQKRGNW